MTDPNPAPVTDHMRTAVLVVHGIGSQRALETVRGVIRGIWLDSGNPYDDGHRVWSHPQQRSGIDIDLTVMTTNEIPGTEDKRCVDFYELYWAHLMSETKAVAVLFWLYELARKGPHLRTGLNGLWWAAAIFLCLVNLSVAVLVLQGILLFAKASSAQTLLVAPFLLVLSCIVFGLIVAMKWRARRLRNALAVFLGASLLIVGAYFLFEQLFYNKITGWDPIEVAILTVLPTLDAMIASCLLMGSQGMRAFCRSVVLSLVMAAIFVSIQIYWDVNSTWKAAFSNSPTQAIDLLSLSWPWALHSPWSAILSFAVLGLYLVVNATFLQSYLGDAARYFRNSPDNVAVRRVIRREAVETLRGLHESGNYDRIVVVAHSLGCVVAYDMLRNYFSRVCGDLPPIDKLNPEFDEIDRAQWQPDRMPTEEDRRALRIKARAVINKIADHTVRIPKPGRSEFKSWLVTDFVTLGSALSHAHFLMCLGRNRSALRVDFARRVREREFPTCPPKRLDHDGLLAFLNPRKDARQVHHGGLFGLTRWSNIYFPISQILWGDAIGGPLGPIFGRHILDVPVSTRRTGEADFFTHTAYWDVDREPDRFQAPHIAALRDAVDLAESGAAIALVDRAVNDETGMAT